MEINTLNTDALDKAAALLPKNTPIVMVNFVKFNDQAQYVNDQVFEPCSGREAYYYRYAPAFNQLAADLKIEGVKVRYVGAIKAGLAIADGEDWDEIVLVDYPSFEDFRRILESTAYINETELHRKAAQQNWRLWATVKP